MTETNFEELYCDVCRECWFADDGFYIPCPCCKDSAKKEIRREFDEGDDEPYDAIYYVCDNCGQERFYGVVEEKESKKESKKECGYFDTGETVCNSFEIGKVINE